MQKKHRIKITAMLLTMSMVLSSCGDKSDSQDTRQTDMGEEQTQAPLELTESIMVDKAGYEADSRKVFLVTAESLPETFRILNADTFEVVYTGKVMERRNTATTEEYTGYGDFSEWKQTGEYFIECDSVGYSNSFSIQTQVYEKVFNEVMQVIAERTENFSNKQGEISSTELMEQIDMALLKLLSYELYPDVYENQQQGAMPELLNSVSLAVERMESLQDEKTGEVNGCEYAFTALISKYAYLVQEYDSKLFTQLQKVADKAWRSAEKATDKEGSRDKDYRIPAAAELYRLTGQNKYRSIVEDYGKSVLAAASETTVSGNQAAGQNSPKASVSGNSSALLNKTRVEYLAQITYLSTRRKVDVDICGQFMKGIMKEAEEIAASATQSPYYCAADGTTEGIDQLMWDITVLSVVDYVITNHEYGQIMENQHHYLSGRNPQAHVYWNSDAAQVLEGIALSDHPLWIGSYLLMLSSILSE